MRRTNLYLDERQTAVLDAMAREADVSRAEVVRRLVDRAANGSQADPQRDLDAIDESFGIAPDFAMPDRLLGERDRYLNGIWRR
ncbi:MAG: ribbon-helix-helix protein, CopG family [Candidatus Dormibacteraceae bacterium]